MQSLVKEQGQTASQLTTCLLEEVITNSKASDNITLLTLVMDFSLQK
jgi:hypothetical protein